MPNPWTERSWNELVSLEDASTLRERNPDSSLAAQFEDLTPLDNTSDHDRDS